MYAIRSYYVSESDHAFGGPVPSAGNRTHFTVSNRSNTVKEIHMLSEKMNQA